MPFLKNYLLPLFAVLPLLAINTNASAEVFPVGLYTLSAQPGTGIHLGPDTGTLTGTVLFDSASTVTAANLVWHDTTLSQNFSFTFVDGPTDISGGSFPFLEARIDNSTDHNDYYELAVRLSTAPNGVFTLGCGVDCDSWISLDNGLYEEVTGSLTPATPEPSSLLLFGTGALIAAALGRRRLRRH